MDNQRAKYHAMADGTAEDWQIIVAHAAHFEATAQFCHRYDQNSFDPDFKSMPLEAFVPMIGRVFARPKNSMYLRKPEAQAAE